MIDDWVDEELKPDGVELLLLFVVSGEQVWKFERALTFTAALRSDAGSYMQILGGEAEK